jgi:hypothetical protein
VNLIFSKKIYIRFPGGEPAMVLRYMLVNIIRVDFNWNWSWSIDQIVNYKGLDYINLSLKYAPVYERIHVKYAIFGKEFRVQDLLVEHVVNRHLV